VRVGPNCLVTCPRGGDMKKLVPLGGVLHLLVACAIFVGCADSGPARLAIRWTLAVCDEAAPEELDEALGILKMRLEALGVASAVDVADDGIVVKTAALPEDLSESDLLSVLTARGGYALHDVVEASDEEASPPDKFKIPVLARPPDPRQPRVFISTEPGFTAVPHMLPTVKEPEGGRMRRAIYVPLSVEARQRLAEFTERRVGKMVGVVIDGKLWTSPRIMERIFGDIHLEVDTTLAAAHVLAALVAAPAMEVCLRVENRESIDEAYVAPSKAEGSEPVIEAGALDLLRRFLDEGELAMREPPASARITMHAAILFDEEAVAEYLWQAPDRERIRASISAVRAWERLEPMFEFPLPAEDLVMFLKRQGETQRRMLRDLGRTITGVIRPGYGMFGLEVDLIDSIVGDPWGLTEAGQVDLRCPSIPEGKMLVVSGVDGGRYDGQEVRLLWLSGEAHVDSLVVLGPELDGRGRLHYITRGGKPLLERLSWSAGKPGDSDRTAMEGWFGYSEIEGYWLAVSMRFESEGDTTVAFEIVDTELDIDLGDVEWSDDISITDQEELIEAQRGTEAERQQKLLDMLREDAPHEN
jgi:hypothetical protein